MTEPETQDELLDALRRANPVRAEALAAPTDSGPTRTLDAILSDSEAAPVAAALPGTAARKTARSIGSRPQRRWISVAAAAALIVAVATAGIIAYDAGTGRDATAAVHDAVTTTIGVSDSMLWETTVTFDFDEFDEPWQLTVVGSLDGPDAEIRWLEASDVPGFENGAMESMSEVIVDGQAYRSAGGGPWQGPVPASAAPVRSNLTFGVAIDDLGGLYDFSHVGTEDIDGVGDGLTHYRTNTTPAGAGAGMLMSLGMGLMIAGAQSPEQLDNVQLDVWIDGDDLIRRVSYSTEIAGTGTFEVVADFSSFGNVTPITVPAS